MTEVISTKDGILDWFRPSFHVHSWQTVKRWKKIGLPIRYLPNRVPFILPAEVIAWVVEHDDVVRGKQKSPERPGPFVGDEG